MRILLVSDSYPPLIGGATRATRQLALALAARGHEVRVATAWQEGAPPAEDDEGIRVDRLRTLTSRLGFLSADAERHTPPPFPDPEATVRFRRLLRAWRPDVVHAYGWLSYSCALALTGTGIPVVLAARDYGNICALRTLVRRGTNCSGPAVVKCLDCAPREYGAIKGIVAVAGVLGGRSLLRRHLDALHSVSVYVQGMMRRHLLGPLADGRRPGPVLQDRVIPDFRDDAPDGIPDQAVLARLPSRPYILYVGALRRIKGLETLFAAYASLPSPPPLVLVGSRAPDTPAVVPPGVTVIEGASHPAVLRAFDGAMFAVAPSLLAEPLGNVVHEAMSRGRAVIGTRPGGHAEMIDDTENGMLVPSGDSVALASAMARLIADPAERDRLGSAAGVAAARFTAARQVPILERLLVSVARGAA